MKKLLVTTLALAATAGIATTAFALIGGSGHDFSSETWAGNQICLPCHTPHNAYTFAPDPDGSNELIPLWNHVATTSTFTPYASPTNTLNATGLAQPTGVSLACLSCHDGTVALDQYGVSPATTEYVTGGFNLGIDLENDHPVSFSYATAINNGDTELHNNANVTSLLVGGAITGTVECSSCHDPHNTPGNAKLLQVTNTNSNLCLTCHNK